MIYARCPICKEPLTREGGSAICSKRHTFDFAKEGYLYLLPPNKKHSHLPGDNPEMVECRRNFLDKGFYSPLASHLFDIVNKLFPNRLTLLDAGVGTGYYLNEIVQKRASNSQQNGDVYLGVDLSKSAVKHAAKTVKSAECVVSSIFDMPYSDGMADVILSVFSPVAWTEFARVLKEDGRLIVVTPNENHLVELRRFLYDDLHETETHLSVDRFTLLHEDRLTFTFSLSGEDLMNLVTMTPYYYKAKRERVQSLINAPVSTVTADFKISIFAKEK